MNEKSIIDQVNDLFEKISKEGKIEAFNPFHSIETNDFGHIMILTKWGPGSCQYGCSVSVNPLMDKKSKERAVRMHIANIKKGFLNNN